MLSLKSCLYLYALKKGIIRYRRCITYQVAGECLQLLKYLNSFVAKSPRLGQCFVVKRHQVVSTQALKTLHVGWYMQRFVSQFHIGSKGMLASSRDLLK